MPIVCPVLIARGQYVAPFERLIESLAEARGQTIAVSGEAGIGKSRLTRELIARAREAMPQVSVIEGHCFERDEALPFAPILDLLRSFTAPLGPADLREHLGDEACELVKLLPELLAHLPDCAPSPRLDHEQEKRRLFHALVQFFVRAAVRQPALVVIEDLHWSDETSLDFLSHLARRTVDLPLILLCTYRADEVGHPLAHFLARLDRERVVTEWPLERLSLDEVATMIAAIFDLSGPPRHDFLQSVYELTDGNPFFIEEVLKSMTSSGGIEGSRDVSFGQIINEIRIPRSVQDAVRQRSSRTSAQAQRLLTYAAVAGRRFDLALLERVSGTIEADMLPLLKELVTAQLIVEEPDERFAFRHALTQQAIYSALLARERRSLHREVAQSIESLGALEDDARLAEVAHHFYEAAVWDRAFEYSLKIGGRAQTLYSPAAAVQHYDRALDAAARAEARVPAWVYGARGAAHEMLGDFARARADYETALAIAKQATDEVGEWEALIDLGSLWATRDYDRTGELFRRALDLARAGSDRLLLAQSLNRYGNWLVNTGRAIEGIEHHDAALEIFEEAGDRQGRGATLDLLGMANGIYGDLATAAARFGEAIVLLGEARDDVRLLSAQASRAVYGGPAMFDTVPGAMRTLDDVRRDGEAAIALGRHTGSSAGIAYAHWITGNALGGFGRFDEALGHAREGLRLAEEVGHEQWITGARCALGFIYMHMLDPDAAASHLEAAWPLAQSLKSAWWIGNVGAFLALTHLQQGDVDAASDLLATVPANRAPRTLSARRLASARAEVFLAKGEPDRARVLIEELLASSPAADDDAPIPPLLWSYGRTLARLDELAAACEALASAVDGARRAGADPWTWRIAATLGDVYLARGRNDEAQASYAEAAVVIDRVATSIADATSRDRFLTGARAALPKQRAPSPRRAASISAGGLTEREREVAAQVTLGRTNREIAATLVVSERTVETHIANIFSKLGFKSRAQLAAWGAERSFEEHP